MALLAAGCGGGDDDSTGATGGGETGGGGTAVKIVSDLPLQGSSAAQTETMNNAIKLYLDSVGGKVGDFTVSFEAFDDSTAAKGAWDEATCAANARKYAEDESILGVIGTYNSGCAEIEVPIANEASLAYVSPANTAVGLTHVGVGSLPGEPDKYYPSGVRNYARVVASDDFQGQVDAAYMKDKLGVTKVYILDDKEAYGKGVADAFEQAAKDEGMTVAGHTGWDANAQNYKALMTQVKASGADGVYIGGIACLNGGQLVKDKVVDRRRQRRGQADGLRRLRPRLALRRGGSRQPRRHVRERSRAQPGGPDRSGEDLPRLVHGEVRRAVRSTRPTPRRRRRCSSTRSAAPTAVAKTSSRSCSRRTSPTASSGRCRSTRTATRRRASISVFLAEASGAPWKFQEAVKVQAAS